MNNSPVKSELYVALEMVELTQFLPFTKYFVSLQNLCKMCGNYCIFVNLHQKKTNSVLRTTPDTVLAELF